jgi:hypothetical protein
MTQTTRIRDADADDDMMMLACKIWIEGAVPV